MDTCSACGKAICGSDVLYSEQGLSICAPCSSVRGIVADEQRSARNTRTVALSSLGIGALGLFMNPLAVCSFLAIGSGLYALRAIGSGEERFTRHLSRADRPIIWITSCLGILLGMFPFLVIASAIAYHVGAR